jgi:hypothetical protein
MRVKILGLTIGIIILISRVAAGGLFCLNSQELKLSDFHDDFRENTFINTGQSIFRLEKESAEAIAEKAKFLFADVSAVAILPHVVVSHIKGEDGADFRIHMHDPHTWNASINNTGNVTLTNIKVIIGENVIQKIPNLEVGKQNDLVTLQSWEYPKNYMLHIICDQEVKEEIELSHTTVGLPLPGSTPSNKILYNKFKWVFALPGLILSILGFVGGGY